MGRVTEGKEKIRARREGWHGWHGASSLLSSSFIITAAEQQLQNNIYIYTQNKCERISKAYVFIEQHMFKHVLEMCVCEIMSTKHMLDFFPNIYVCVLNTGKKKGSYFPLKNLF